MPQVSAVTRTGSISADRRPWTALTPRQHAEHHGGQIARPAFDPGGVAAEPAQRRDAPIAINQNSAHAAIPSSSGRDRLGAGDARVVIHRNDFPTTALSNPPKLDLLILHGLLVGADPQIQLVTYSRFRASAYALARVS
jgi:hypothetical protein